MAKREFQKRAPFYFDVDDTILSEKGEGPPFLYAKEVIEGLIAKGIEVNIWSARGRDWAKHITENILKVEGVNAYLTKPQPKKTFDDNPERLATRLVGAQPLLHSESWYLLGMKYLMWKKKKTASVKVLTIKDFLNFFGNNY